MNLGYALSSEEWDPRALVELAVQAESTGFTFALISGHDHPWTDRQGNSPFVWSVRPSRWKMRWPQPTPRYGQIDRVEDAASFRGRSSRDRSPT